jgi:sugar/nucleoside kinase (ribokinase family)
VASRLGAKVSVCTNIPVPTPKVIERFLDEFAVDSRFLRGVPGNASVRVVAQCADGQAVFERAGMDTLMPIELPAAATCGVDATLVDACAFRNRSGIARTLARYLDQRTSDVTVGLRLDDRCRGSELSLAHDEHVWTFLRQPDARHLLDGCSQGCGEARESRLVQRIHDEFGIARLVLQLGDEGAVMLNGNPCPYHVHTCPVLPTEYTAPGDTLLAVTTLASAAGADDRTSLRRGVAAATGQVAGLELPTSLEELDAA